MKILFITLAFTLATSVFAQTTPATALSLIDVNSQLIKELTKATVHPSGMQIGNQIIRYKAMNGIQYLQYLANPDTGPNIINALGYIYKFPGAATREEKIRAALQKAYDSAVMIGTPESETYAARDIKPLLQMFDVMSKNPYGSQAGWITDAQRLLKCLQ